MTKDDWIWVAIRIFGIYLVVLAIVSIPGIIHSGMMTRTFWCIRQIHDSRQQYHLTPSDVMKQLDAEGKTVSEEEVVSALTGFDTMDHAMGKMSSTLFASSLSSLVSSCSKLLLFAGCGLYFLRGGKLFFKMISRGQKQTEEGAVQNQ